jgi:hypothetical protein
MIDETDLSTEKMWFYEVRARMAVTNLRKRNLNAQGEQGLTYALRTQESHFSNWCQQDC